MKVFVLIINFSNGQLGVASYGEERLALEAVDGVKKMGDRFKFDDYSIHETTLTTELPPGE